MRKEAVFTIVKNEPLFLPVWLQHYSRYFYPEDIYVLDNGSTDKSADVSGCNVIKVPALYSYDVYWLKNRVEAFQKELFHKGYDLVVFAEVDEIIVPGLGSFDAHLSKRSVIRCTAYEILHVPTLEKALDWKSPIMAQRRYWFRHEGYDKPLVSKAPLSWVIGFHEAGGVTVKDPELTLIHLRKVDYASFMRRFAERRTWARPPGQPAHMSRQWHNEIGNPDKYFFKHCNKKSEIPERFKDVI